MMRFLADENFDNDVLDEVKKQTSEMDVVRVQDIPEIYMRPDSLVLAWAAKHDRILLTRDTRTIEAPAYARVAEGLFMPGVILVPQNLKMAKVIDDLLTIIGASDPSEYVDTVARLPL